MDIDNIFHASLLSQSAYADDLDPGDTGSTLENGLVDAKLDEYTVGVANGMTQSQAKLVGDSYEVIYQQPTTDSGFSATLFREIDSTEYTLSMRGTDTSLIGVDWLSANLGNAVRGFARDQVVDMINFYLRLTQPASADVSQYKYDEVTQLSPPSQFSYLVRAGEGQTPNTYAVLTLDTAAPGLGVINTTTQLTTTGHSLGGHLASAFSLLFPDVTQHTFTFNSAGFIGWSSNEFDQFSNLVSGTVSDIAINPTLMANYDEALVTDVSATVDAVSRLPGQSHLGGGRIDVEVEYLTAADVGPIDAVIRNHSMDKVSDSLSVISLLSLMDSSLTIEDANQMLESASNESGTSLERTVNHLAKFFLKPGIAVSEGYHEEVYSTVSNISNSVVGASLEDTFSVERVTSLAAMLATQDTSIGRANRYTLINLLPFTIEGGFTGTASADPMYNLTDSSGNSLYSDAYFFDKAEMLHVMLEQNTDDLSNPVVQPKGSPVFYRDSLTHTNFLTGQVDLPSGGQALNEFEVNRVVFGDDSNNAFIQGGVKSDRLYGQGGNDILTGSKGDDYLEGGSGTDQFIWNPGDGNDFIGDYDDGGDRIIVNGIDLAMTTLSFTQTATDSPFYTSSTNPDITLRYDGGALEIHVGSGPDKGVITVNGYSTAADGNYGIALSAFSVAPPPEGDLVVQALGSSTDPADNEIRISAYDREVTGQHGRDWSATAIQFSAVDIANYTAGSLHGTFEGTFEGGPVIDYLTGDAGSNALHGLAGEDTIKGEAGDDFIEGGGGSDKLFGGAGNDLVFGSARAGLTDRLDSGSARDQFYLGQITSGSSDINTLDGGLGNDHLSGGEYTDYLEGGAGTDYLLGGTGRDFINGGGDRDIIYGDSVLNYRYVELTPGVASEKLEIAFADGTDSVGKYDDVITAGAGNDTVWGELGNDEIHGDEGDDNLIGDRYNSVDYFSAELSAYSQTSPDLAVNLHGDDKLYGGAGDDLLLGNGGDDFLAGGIGIDSLVGGAGNDTYYSQSGDGLDYIEDSEGTHTLLFRDAALDDLQIVYQGDQVRVTTKLGQHGFYFSKDQWANTQLAVGTTETIFERSRLDTVYLDGAGNALITVAGVNDLSEVQRDEIFTVDDTDSGRPRIVVGAGADDVEIEALAEQEESATMRIRSGLFYYTVDLSAFQIATGFEFLTLPEGLVASLVNFSGGIVGTSGSDHIIGGSAVDTIDGLAGNDSLEGRGGDDHLDGGTGDDLLLGGNGDDDLYGGVGHDRDTLNGGPGNDELNGGFGPDIYQFNVGDGQDLLIDANGYHYFEFGPEVNPDEVVLNFTATSDSNFRLEYAPGDAVFSHGITQAHWIRELWVDGIEIPLVLRSDQDDGVLRDTRADDVFESEAGNDSMYVSGWGDNAFRLFTGDGQDTIYIDNGFQATRMGEIRFAADVDLSTLSYTFTGAGTTIAYGDGDQLTLNPDTIFSISDNALMRFTVVSEADPDWIPTISPQDSHAELYGSFGADNISGDDGRDIIFPGYGNDVINAGGGPDEIILNDIYMAQGSDGIGYKNISGGVGNDLITTPLFQGLTFDYAMGDGSDVISYDWSYSHDKPYQFDVDWNANTVAFDPKGLDVISFGVGITLADLQFVRSGDVLEVSVHDGAGSIHVEGFFHAWDAEALDPPSDLFDLFGEGVGFDSLLQPYVLSLLPKTPISLLQFADGSTYDMSTVLNAFLAPSSLIEGTNGADVITGTAGDDVIVGGRGSDTMDGGAGDDTFAVEGLNQGRDIIVGGEGFDVIQGGAGDDRIRLQSLSLADSIERIDAGAGFNTVAGTNARNHLDFSVTELLNIAQIEAGGGRDIVIGSQGDDIIVGGAGNDELEGGAGDDTFIVEGVGQGKDLIAGGEGFDRIIGGSLDDKITLKSLSLLDSIERIDGGLGVNTIVGTQGKNTFDFSATELLHIDQINGEGGRDTIIGSQGDDVLSGGRGNDILSGLGGNDSYLFALGDGRDTIKNNDAASGSTDRLDVVGINYDDLWLSRSGNHLLVDVVGSDDRVKVRGWFSSDRQQLDAIYAGDRVLLRNQVGLLVNAMASFDVPTGVGAVIPPDTRLALEPVLANVWEAA